jgi:adenosylhomocysteine nucleosidase
MVIGLICALPQEFEAISSMIQWEETGPTEAFPPVKRGELAGKELYLCMSGMGKVMAAAAAQGMIARYSPSLLLSFGSAGALEGSLSEGTIICPGMVIPGDFGVYDPEGFHYTGSPLLLEGVPRFFHAFEAHRPLVERCERLSRQLDLPCSTGALLTCDQVVFSKKRRAELGELFCAVAVDMESAAIAQIARANNIPFMALRAISDGVDLEITHLDELLLPEDELPGGKVLRGVWNHPGMIPSLHRLRKGMRSACTSLGKILPPFLQQLPKDLFSPL